MCGEALCAGIGGGRGVVGTEGGARGFVAGWGRRVRCVTTTGAGGNAGGIGGGWMAEGWWGVVVPATTMRWGPVIGCVARCVSTEAGTAAGTGRCGEEGVACWAVVGGHGDWSCRWRLRLGIAWWVIVAGLWFVVGSGVAIAVVLWEMVAHLGVGPCGRCSGAAWCLSVTLGRGAFAPVRGFVGWRPRRRRLRASWW